MQPFPWWDFAAVFVCREFVHFVRLSVRPTVVFQTILTIIRFISRCSHTPCSRPFHARALLCSAACSSQFIAVGSKSWAELGWAETAASHLRWAKFFLPANNTFLDENMVLIIIIIMILSLLGPALWAENKVSYCTELMHFNWVFSHTPNIFF